MPNIIIGKDGAFQNGFFDSDGSNVPVNASITYDAGNVTATNGQQITTWPEANNASYDLTLTTSGSQNPEYVSSQINGNPAVRFFGNSDDEMSTNLGNLFNNIAGMSMYIVYEPSISSGIGFDALVEFDDGSDRITIIRRFGSSTNVAYAVDGGTGVSTNLVMNGGFSTGTYYLFKWVHESNGNVSLELYAEGGATDTQSFSRSFPTKNRPTFNLCPSDQPFNGYIAEVAAYNTALNSTDDTSVTNYFLNKYGL